MPGNTRHHSPADKETGDSECLGDLDKVLLERCFAVFMVWSFVNSAQWWVADRAIASRVRGRLRFQDDGHARD